MDSSYPYPLLTAADLRAMRVQAGLQRSQMALGMGYTVKTVDLLLSGQLIIPDVAALRFIQLYMRTIAAADQYLALAS